MASVRLTSRASVKIRDNFYTFEACIEKSCPDDLSKEDYENFKQELWNEVNGEVESQVSETWEYLKNRGK